MSQTVIDVGDVQEGKECPICLACLHYYHKTWLDHNTTCPICRYQVVVDASEVSEVSESFLDRIFQNCCCLSVQLVLIVLTTKSII